MSGLATREILRRQYEVHGLAAYERLATISNGHLYNLRKSTVYRSRRTLWTKAQATAVAIGERRAPRPGGCAGFVRVDTVHQGDRDGVKGLYLINLVDEVTQFQFIGVVCGISERFLAPVLEGLLRSFPFDIKGFHADNGSEYINHKVAALLDKLDVGAFTKSRARRSNDNALVEGKNGHVVRKYFGHDHIPQRFAEIVNRFAMGALSPFLDFHRPCLFATEYVNAEGKTRRKYLAADVMTPYAKWRSLKRATMHQGRRQPRCARRRGARRHRHRSRHSRERRISRAVQAHLRRPTARRWLNEHQPRARSAAPRRWREPLCRSACQAATRLLRCATPLAGDTPNGTAAKVLLDLPRFGGQFTFGARTP